MSVALDRKPAFAGQFYPDDPEELRAWIESRLRRAKTEIEGEVLGIISPHAGYVFSGSTAAKAWKALDGVEVDVIIVLGPVHKEGISFASVLTEGSYSTPLGVVRIDSEVASAISARDEDIRASSRGHALDGLHDEHSIEVQIPFLQIVQPDTPIVPIVMGNHSLEFAERLATAITEAVAGKRAVLVASTDLSHYFSFRDAKHLDRVFIREVDHFDPEQLYQMLLEHKTMACGAGPVLTTMVATKKMGANHSQVIKWTTSADSPYRDFSRVVGYLAASFSKADIKPVEKKEEDSTTSEEDTGSGDIAGKPDPSAQYATFDFETISEAQKQLLLRVTRVSIRNAILGEQAPPVKSEDPILRQKCGCFVTLKKSGQLRGCIGFIEVDKPLLVTLREAAQAAAMRDPRFPPISRDELNQITIEVSLLTPLESIEAENVTPGIHGLYLINGMNRGLLLPQVATERGWDRETFLENTCLKAGLKRDCWMNPETSLFAFRAYIFSDFE